MRLPVMDRFLHRISEEELKEQRESAGEDAQFLDLKYQEVDRDTVCLLYTSLLDFKALKSL